MIQWMLAIWSLCCPAAAKSLQSCPPLCDPIDCSPPGSPVPEILQARTLEWVAISFNAWKWSRSVVSDPQWSHGLQPTRLLHPWNFPGKSTGVGCHCLLCFAVQGALNSLLQHHSSKASILPALSLLYGLILISVHNYWKNHSFDYKDLYQQSNISAF